MNSASSGLSEMRCLASRIPDPENYYKGSAVRDVALPENILCFTRRNASDLMKAPDQSASHQHHRSMLLTSLGGSGRLCLDADNFVLEPGHSQLIAPFQFHSYLDIQPQRICWIFVTFEISSASDLEAQRSSRPRPLGPVERTLLREIIHCWLDADRHSLLPLHLGLLLARLRTIGPSAGPPPRRNKADAGADLIAEINRYVLPRLNQTLGLKRLARVLGHSESHLRAKFRQATGVGLGTHLRGLRIQKACRLLRISSLRVGAIADQCGFESVYSFSRTFKAACGISPRAYRLEGAASPVPVSTS